MTFDLVIIDEEETIRIDTTIPVSVRNYIKNNGYKVNELIRLGILAKENNPQLISRISSIEEKYRSIDIRLNVIIGLLQEKGTEQ